MSATLVFLHGIFGSHLETQSGERVWPPSAKEFITKSYNKDDLLVQDDLIVTGVIRKVSCKSVYKPLIKDLEAIGFAENGGGAKGDLNIFAYDWRRDLRTTSDALAKRLDSLNTSHNIHLVAHSMGGLICRYLLESGHYHNRPWFTRIQELITLATPHFGAAQAMEQALGLEGTMGMKKETVKTLASHPAYPSAYQLMPPRGVAYIRDIIDGEDEGKVVNPFDPNFIATHGLSAANMAANDIFHSQLNLQHRKPGHVDYYFFVSSKEKTLNRFQLLGNAFMAQYDKDGGDGTVPTYSAGSPYISTQYVSGKHSSVFTSNALREKLYKLLGAPDHIRPVNADGEVVDQFIVQNIIIPDDPQDKNVEMPLTLIFREPLKTFEDTLLFKALPDIDGNTDIPIGDGQNLDIHYSGPPIESLTMTVETPGKAGFYEVLLNESSLGEPASVILTVATG